MTKYYITEEQLETLDHYKNMFSVNAERVNQLCKQETPDITIGFELGELHSHLRECFMNMMQLEGEIRKQKEEYNKEALTKTLVGDHTKCLEEIVDWYIRYENLQKRESNIPLNPEDGIWANGYSAAVKCIEAILKKYNIIIVPTKEPKE
jgi:hypothetical protein